MLMRMSVIKFDVNSPPEVLSSYTTPSPLSRMYCMVQVSGDKACIMVLCSSEYMQHCSLLVATQPSS